MYLLTYKGEKNMSEQNDNTKMVVEQLKKRGVKKCPININQMKWNRNF